MYLAKNGNQNYHKSCIASSPDKELLGRANCRWNDSIRMHLIKTTRGGIIWLQVAQIKRYWWDHINMIIVACLHKRGGGGFLNIWDTTNLLREKRQHGVELDNFLDFFWKHYEFNYMHISQILLHASHLTMPCVVSWIALSFVYTPSNYTSQEWCACVVFLLLITILQY